MKTRKKCVQDSCSYKRSFLGRNFLDVVLLKGLESAPLSKIFVSSFTC